MMKTVCKGTEETKGMGGFSVGEDDNCQHKPVNNFPSSARTLGKKHFHVGIIFLLLIREPNVFLLTIPNSNTEIHFLVKTTPGEVV